LPVHATIIVSLAAGEDSLCRVFSQSPLVYCGELAQSLFIFHVPVAYLSVPLLHYLVSLGYTVGWLEEAAVTWSFALGSAWLGNRAISKPMRWLMSSSGPEFGRLS